MSKQSKILVVDDAASIVSLMLNILEPYYEVKTANCGEQALEILKEYKPDLILLDVVMTGINGYEVCKKVRSLRGNEFVKILIVSSQTMLEERLLGYDAGADDYVPKPFREEELLAKVKVFLRLKAVEDQLFLFNEQLNEQIKIRTEQLLNSEKLAAIGRYAAGIIHNLNSPLQAIMGNAELLAMKNPDNKNIMNLRKAAAHMKKIISSILSTSYMESSEENVRIDLNEVIKNQIELMTANPFFKHKIITKLDLKPLPQYRGIYVHFSQSLGNLIKNAIDAMYETSEKVLTIRSFIKNNTIHITISDTGHGIPKEKFDKIFHPFYTTKPLTASDERPTGTGLGLASCKEMIESYSGKIFLESEIGKGSTFTILLPLRNSRDSIASGNMNPPACTSSPN